MSCGLRLNQKYLESEPILWLKKKLDIIRLKTDKVALLQTSRELFNEWNIWCCHGEEFEAMSSAEFFPFRTAKLEYPESCEIKSPKLYF